TQIALVYHILERTTLTLELLGHTHHKPQIGDDQLLMSPSVSSFDSSGKLNFSLRF
ncbi:unnamed protein product, partial [marine sediment metagenome]